MTEQKKRKELDMYSFFERRRIAKAIASDVYRRWKWSVNVKVTADGDVHWNGNRKNNPDRYDMYPGMARWQADLAVMDEILSIIRRYIPDFRYTSYEQSGRTVTL